MGKYIAFIAAAIIFSTSATSAQDVGSNPAPESLIGRPVLARTSGGGEFQGTLLSALGDRLELVDGEGRIVALHRPSLVSIEALRVEPGKKDRGYFFRDAAENRLIVMPTAFPIEPGEVHLASQEIAAVTMSWGAADRLSVWGGVSIPGAVANLRYSILLDDAGAISVGSFAGTTWTPPVNSALMPYLIASFGDGIRNFTAALAAPAVVVGDGAPYFAGPLIALGGKTPVSRSAALVFESWFFYWSDFGRWSAIAAYAFPACAFRIAGGRFSWDIGAVLPLWFEIADGTPRLGGMGEDALIPLPLLSLTYRLE